MTMLSLLLALLVQPVPGLASPLSLATPPVQAEAPRPALKLYNLGKESLAIDGYDPVSYFPEGGGSPRKGDSNRSLVWRGVRYRFATDANRVLFEQEPERFEPAYGGWCAYAMAKGEKVEIDPESYVLHGGRLFLFYKSFFNDTRKKWLAEESKLCVKADAGWLKIAQESPPRNALLCALDEGDLGLQGYDPTSYQAVDGKAPVLGSPEHSLRHQGIVYRFQSAESLALFRADPARYEPAFGGWSALGMAEGKRLRPDPRDYLLEAGRLLLFHRDGQTDLRPRWKEAESELLKRAEAAWKRMLQEG